ncbi:hypothetical protein RhiirA4_477006 [Rhizophagus irregularis]|uniref:Uncharacterized protein n=1 Tax=Rhizophagus irregularis TaxID=588596 RepID=A0A2I1HCH9_9GLOM|nr:hypothetical protein RhiirA4_477006 [Rhizophagus irregularis]
MADALAKAGCEQSEPITISPSGIKLQKGYIMFNDEFIIDYFTMAHLINWEYTQD